MSNIINSEDNNLQDDKNAQEFAELAENRDKLYKIYKLNINSRYYKKLRLLAIYFNKDETLVLEDAVDYLYDKYYKELLSGVINKDFLNLALELSLDKKNFKSFKINSNNGIRTKKITIMTIEFDLTINELLNLIIEIFFKDKFKLEEI